MNPDSIFLSQPPRIKAFIDKVIQCPLQDIAIPLSGFRWEFGKVVISPHYSYSFPVFHCPSTYSCSVPGEFPSLETIIPDHFAHQMERG